MKFKYKDVITIDDNKQRNNIHLKLNIVYDIFEDKYSLTELYIHKYGYGDIGISFSKNFYKIKIVDNSFKYANLNHINEMVLYLRKKIKFMFMGIIKFRNNKPDYPLVEWYCRDNNSVFCIYLKTLNVLLEYKEKMGDKNL